MSKVQAGFWRDKRVLITGHTGFKGSWLTFWLLRMGAKVTGISLEPETSPNLFTLLKLEEKLDRHHIHDIRDDIGIKSLVSDAAPDIAFHLAAQSLVPLAHNEPQSTFATNFMGTVNVLEALRLQDSARVTIAITTDKVYENREWPWAYRETDRLGGHEPYGASKAASEIAISAYRHCYFSPNNKGLAAVRAGNVVGGGDWAPSRLVPDAVRAFQVGKPLELRNPYATRPWQHVFEPLSGYMLLAQRGWDNVDLCNDPLNFGPDLADVRTVAEVADVCSKTWGGNASWEAHHKGSANEAQLLGLDNAKAKQVLEWQPTWAFQECMSKTISWYKENEKAGNMINYSHQQLDEFNG